MNILKVVIDAEEAISAGSSDERVSAVVVDTLATLCGAETKDFASVLDLMADRQNRSRDAALFLLRSLALRPIYDLCADASMQVQRRVVKAIEINAADIIDSFGIDKMKQASEKFSSMMSVFSSVMHRLSPLQRLPENVNAIVSDSADIYRTLNDKEARRVLSIYGYSDFASQAKNIISSIKAVSEADDHNFSGVFHSAIGDAVAISEYYGGRGDILSVEICRPFIHQVVRSLRKLGDDSMERFACHLRSKFGGGQSGIHPLERRYPLHDPQRLVRVKVPLVNEGPGPAMLVKVEIATSAESVLIAPTEQELGVVPAGEFQVHFDLLLGEPVGHLDLIVQMSWTSARGGRAESSTFECRLLAQDSTVDWDALSVLEPYSTEVAKGAAFVGRQAKLNGLVARFKKARMQSSFITGQKRVGKTSLAIATTDRLSQDSNYEIVYLEYGEYAQPTAAQTVEYLCELLFDQLERLGATVTDHIRSRPRSSLAVINMLAQSLYDSKPELRIVVVLDEFDEIHPEMYRFGPLAETFFSNLRTLSAKPNLSFILVGGENMPFIVSAQGDQLNKFVAEELSYFLRSEEWDDFERLVARNDLPITWHRSAMEGIFRYTNGHPYYVNLLCSKIFQLSVASRDTDVTEEEVESALARLVQQLSTNAFAHFWKDGIAGDRDQAEVISLKRCQLLVGLARAMRAGQATTLENITIATAPFGLTAVDTRALIDDFIRREVLQEQSGAVEFVVPVLGEWLKANGVRLIADSLGAEIEREIKTAEEMAYVTSPELLDLTERWPLYKGSRIGPEQVRAWLQQVGSNVSQRILFKVLSALDVVGEERVREMLRTVHSTVKFATSSFAIPTGSRRRYDLLVTYVDGPAKSGSAYASKYAEENRISSTCVIELDSFSVRAAEVEKSTTANGIVIVDDIAVTGDSLSSNVTKFMELHRDFAEERNLPIIVAVMFATREADERLRRDFDRLGYEKLELRVCTLLTENNEIMKRNDLWDTPSERSQAHRLIEELGRRIYGNNPFGYGGKGLNIVFYDTCPNNTLPFLHSPGRDWKPLFPRSVN